MKLENVIFEIYPELSHVAFVGFFFFKFRPSVELAEIDEVAVRVQRRSLYVFPSVATALYANGTCRVCVNMCALRTSTSSALEKRKQCV